jgi:hypothetical protein
MLPLLDKLKSLLRARRENRHGKIDGFLFPDEGTRLSERDWELAKSILSKTSRLIQRRSEYIHEHQLNANVYCPAANWRLENEFYVLTEAISAANYEVVNHLRLFAQMFTGYSLLDMDYAADKDIPGALPADRSAHLRAIAAKPDEWVTRYVITTRRLPPHLHISPPRMFGETGWIVKGKIVNHDTYAYLERISLLHEAGILDYLLHWNSRRALVGASDLPVVLEIGSGYGGLAYFIKQLIPNIRYIAVDLPECLQYAAVYLSVLYQDAENQLCAEGCPEPGSAKKPGFTFVPNYMFQELARSGLRCDLVINTLSMSEMSPEQVLSYCEGIKGLIRGSGVFFEQNQDNRGIGLLDAKAIIQEHFPFRRQLVGAYLNSIYQGVPTLWSMCDPSWLGSPSDIMTRRARPVYPPKLIREMPIHNIVLFDGDYYALPKAGGRILLDLMTAEEIENIPGVVIATSEEQLIQQIQRDGTSFA